jgi:hypothetical protein
MDAVLIAIFIILLIILTYYVGIIPALLAGAVFVLAYNNTIRGGAEWYLTSTDKIDDDTLQNMFEMYKKTYGGAGQTLWFKSKESLKNYPCNVFILKDDKIRGFIMYQLRDYMNKISLLVHDNTSEMKEMVMVKVVELLKMHGWMLEAAGAPSWILRSKYGLKPIMDKDIIEKALGIAIVAGDQKQYIEMNPDYKHDKNSHVYKHHYVTYKDGVEVNHIVNDESLFGNICYKFTKNSCDRECGTQSKL